MAEMTPMKRQYQQIKQKNPDCLLFFRLGDFYEMFDEDAKVASKELDLALTTRDRNKPEPERTPMCGVPYHSAEAYIARLLSRGYKIAVCEQLEDPALAKGLVQRDVIRIITPGTVTESSMLDEGRSNYAAAVWVGMDHSGAAAFCDISTGEFCVAACASDAQQHLTAELGRFEPAEALLSAEAAGDEILNFLTQRLNCRCERSEPRFDPEVAHECLRRQFGEIPEGLPEAAVLASGALLSYIGDMQKRDLSHIKRLDLISGGRYMELDFQTRRNLELTENLRTGEKKGSLLGVLDRTRTPMGGRLLRSWTERPLLTPTEIRRRLGAVEELVCDNVRRGELREELGGIGDIQRLMARAACGTANARDLSALGSYCGHLPKLTELLGGVRGAMLQEIAKMDVLQDVSSRINYTLCDNPPFSVREGDLLRPGFVKEVDELRNIRDHGTDLLRELEARERERTGIRKLRVGYNKVFGYYIDIPNSAADQPLPEDYIRRQTLTNAERYITSELKELENALLTARDRLGTLEYQYFEELRNAVAAQSQRLQETAQRVAELDALCSLAEAAARGGWCCPEVDMGRTLHIISGRHPVVEQMLDTPFVPNNTTLNDADDRVAIVTGPNMAGKSTYMRQTALIVLLAQMGSFVPASAAHVGIVDRVFTRIGASDDLATGRSTFMVEMTEVAEILRQATSQSLLILDEIGRGTSTYDGLAIARAVLEYCADKRRLGARTMFSTHYRELTVLEGALPGVRNYNITARKQGGELIFLRKIVPGAADNSYGIEVARLAGVPETVVKRARACLRELEQGAPVLEASPGGQAAAPSDDGQLSLRELSAQAVSDELAALELDTLTPIEALGLLYQLQKKVRGQ